MTINTIKCVFIILMLSNLVSCKGQDKPVSNQTENKHFDIGKQVSELDNQIWTVFQDKEGNYWFGSNGDGLYHFDGETTTQITTNDGLAHNQIRGIQEDVQGNIYIETPNGVSKFDGTKFTTLEVTTSPNNEWKLKSTDLWFNCNGNANHVYRYDGEHLFELQLPAKEIEKKLGIKEYLLSYSPYTVFGIDRDKSGNLWIGTILAGAFRFDGEAFLWIGEKELSRLPDGREPGVRSILEDNDGHIWLSNFISKYKIDSESSNQYEKLPTSVVPDELLDGIAYFNAGLMDENGDLWMTTYGDGVWKYDGKTLSNVEINHESEELLIVSIYQDNQGTIWLGTNNDGVYKQTGNTFKKFEPKM